VENPLKSLEESVRYIKGKIKGKPQTAVILGTGLGNLAEEIRVRRTLPYKSIPYFPHSTVASHAGQLIFGQYGKKEILVMQGRAHLYEGYTPKEITFPIRIMKKLGIRNLIISNAAGGLNPLFQPGDVMAISDHINLTGHNPLLGPNLETFGPRFPDMTAAYDKKFFGLAEKAALEEKIQLRRGVYAGILGPNLETPAETRFLRMIGADAVGMSTILEVIAAVHSGFRILGFSAISNVNLPDCMQPAPLKEIIANASLAGKKMTRIIEGVLKKM
jgi:purine-nucleoside phosphorylase